MGIGLDRLVIGSFVFSLLSSIIALIFQRENKLAWASLLLIAMSLVLGFWIISNIKLEAYRFH